MDMVWLLGADEIDMKKLGKTFVVYQGHHGDAGAHRADVILPGAAYTEKHAIYVNTEGRAQMGQQAVFPPGGAKEDWAIIRAMSEVIGKTLPFNSLAELRTAMVKETPSVAKIGKIEPVVAMPLLGKKADISGTSTQAFNSVIHNFYMTDPISRASETMAKCTVEILGVAKAEAA
jgi:NADH-quinone oxidoreductase subunit G